MLTDKTIPIFDYRDGDRVVVGRAVVPFKWKTKEADFSVEPGDVEDEVVLRGEIRGVYTTLFSMPASEFEEGDVCQSVNNTLFKP